MYRGSLFFPAVENWPPELGINRPVILDCAGDTTPKVINSHLHDIPIDPEGNLVTLTISGNGLLGLIQYQVVVVPLPLAHSLDRL
jgi:hypothetical protein